MIVPSLIDKGHVHLNTRTKKQVTGNENTGNESRGPVLVISKKLWLVEQPPPCLAISNVLSLTIWGRFYLTELSSLIIHEIRFYMLSNQMMRMDNWDMTNLECGID